MKEETVLAREERAIELISLWWARKSFISMLPYP